MGVTLKNGSCTFYAKGFDDEWNEVIKIENVDIETEFVDPPHISTDSLSKELFEFFATVRSSIDTIALWNLIAGFESAVLEAAPNSRVKHLAKHAKKDRTRKKNYHRIVRDIERRK